MISRAFVAAAAACMLIPLALSAQTDDGDLATLRLLGVPVSALPPISLPMPASRNHNYFIGNMMFLKSSQRQFNILGVVFDQQNSHMCIPPWLQDHTSGLVQP